MQMRADRWVAIAGLGFVFSLTWATRSDVEATRTGIERTRVDWIALNPEFRDATFVNDPEVCAVCHADYMETFEATQHARAFTYGRMPDGGLCESCHGPRSKHVDEPGRELAHERLSASQQSAVCLQCHEGGSRMGWKVGPHLMADVSCSSCHYVMERRSPRALLIREDGRTTCYTCHGEVRAEMFKASHHPVREGGMDCSSCHNIHGAMPGLMRTITVNETCVSCHTEKRGPFVWEHAPVRESCLNCHEPHGSSNRNMLARKDPFLCMQCHSYGGHVNLPRYNRVSTTIGSGCVNCHITTHGSNHPSGAKQTR
jgi:DmsE family decaheme c-type cytochrome